MRASDHDRDDDDDHNGDVVVDDDGTMCAAVRMQARLTFRARRVVVFSKRKSLPPPRHPSLSPAHCCVCVCVSLAIQRIPMETTQQRCDNSDDDDVDDLTTTTMTTIMCTGRVRCACYACGALAYDTGKCMLQWWPSCCR